MSFGIVDASLAAALLAEATGLAVLVVGIVWPEYRIWPPGDVSWRLWFFYGIVAILMVGLGVVGYETAGGFVFSGPVWYWTGVGIIVGVSLIYVWTYLNFGIREGAGLEGELLTGGPYQFTRNPQVIGVILGLIGLIFVVNSFLFTIASLPVFVAEILIPFTEESWLREQYGEEYEEYCEEVPRFLGRKSLSNLGAR